MTRPSPKRSKKRKLLIALVVVFILLLGAGVWSLLIEPGRLIVHEEQLTLANWPSEFDGLRIAVVSDIHAGSPHITEAKIDEVVARVNSLRPDAIFLLGDFMVGNVHKIGGAEVEPELIAARLTNLRARYGVFAVLGNHDWWYDGQRVITALRATHIRVLENEVAPLAPEVQSIWVAGLADLWTRPQAIEETVRRVPPGGYTIAFTHNPDIFPDVPASVGLTLAGHTHGGQVNLPLLGRLVVPSDFGQRYARGHVSENGHDLYVTSGVGTSIMPIRFDVPPEICLLTLRPQK